MSAEVSAEKVDPRVTKRRVTMATYSTTVKADGGAEVQKHEAIDFVRPDFLDAYVADAKTKWQSVTVSEEPDAGPGGYDGETNIPGHIDHPQAGSNFPATEA